MMRQRAITPEDRNAIPTGFSHELLASVSELNLQYLQLMQSQASCDATRSVNAVVREMHALLMQLDPEASRRAAQCPYLLMDVGFADPHRWLRAREYRVTEREAVFAEGYPPTPAAISLIRVVLAYGWHLSHAHAGPARILLGMSTSTAGVIRTYTLGRMTDLAEQQPQWLQPRWPAHLRMWRALLAGAIEGEGEQLEQARLRGVQLLAAQARSSALP